MLKRLFILISLFPAIVFASDAVDNVLQIAMAPPSDPSDAGGALYLRHQLSPKKLKLKSKAAIVADRFGNEVYAKRGCTWAILHRRKEGRWHLLHSGSK